MSKAQTKKTQVAVIGAGPGGYAAAFTAAELGLETTLICEEDRLGGVCLLRGCIPSKALLHVAKLLNEARHGDAWGVSFGEPKIDVDKLRGWKEDIIKKLTGGINQLAKMRKVRVIHARARFADAHTLTLQAGEGAKDVPERLAFEHCILASGSKATVPGPFKIDDPRVMTSKGALDLPDIPGSLLVVGGGYIGLEMGTVYAALGTRVSVVELMDGLLPGADRDLVKPLQKRLGESFENIWTSTNVKAIKPGKKGVVVEMEGKDAPASATFDRVLLSVGRRPNSADLGLENTKVEVDAKGFVKHDAQMRTAEPSIFVIGDVAGEPMLAHKAHREAKVAAEVIAGHRQAFDSVAIPAVVFTDPEVAWTGLTENEAKQQGLDYTVAKFPWTASGRALSIGGTDGLTKVIVDKKTERVLGVGIVGPSAGDLISEAVLAIEMGAVARDLGSVIHPHPTLSETIMEAAEAFYGEATHIARARK